MKSLHQTDGKGIFLCRQRSDLLHRIVIVMLVAAHHLVCLNAQLRISLHASIGIYNRPLAKLDKAIKIADTSNQGKAKCETASAVSIAFREDTKPFDKADSVFNKDTYLLDLADIFALLFGQQMSLGTLFRQKRIGVYQGKTLVSGIRLQHRFCLDMDTRILE